MKKEMISKAMKLTNQQLRQHNSLLRKNLKRIVSCSADNERAQERMDEMESVIYEAPTLKAMFDGLVTQGRRIFEINIITVAIEESLRACYPAGYHESGRSVFLESDNIIFLPREGIAEVFHGRFEPSLRGHLVCGDERRNPRGMHLLNEYGTRFAQARAGAATHAPRRVEGDGFARHRLETQHVDQYPEVRALSTLLHMRCDARRRQPLPDLLRDNARNLALQGLRPVLGIGDRVAVRRDTEHDLRPVQGLGHGHRSDCDTIVGGRARRSRGRRRCARKRVVALHRRRRAGDERHQR